MGILGTVSSALSASADSTADAAGSDSKGAYWCDDCGVRVRDVAVDDEGLDRGGDGTPLCPDCGDAMRFERNHADGCAC
ncbi:hypothetical protein [Halobacterium yunchengense]|uniref:hypothetical protein n=1 Tax=Halobacterium yunchengense TaxID=3108497 RepID=UPI00300B64FC